VPISYCEHAASQAVLFIKIVPTFFGLETNVSWIKTDSLMLLKLLKNQQHYFGI